MSDVEIDYKTLFEECAEARDMAGFMGSVPECIAYLDGTVATQSAEITKLTAERDEAQFGFDQELRLKQEAISAYRAAKAERDGLAKALEELLPPKLDWREGNVDSYRVEHKASAINAARAALASYRNEGNP